MHGKVVKGERIFRGIFSGDVPPAAAARAPVCNRTTRNSIFPIDTTSHPAQNFRKFFRSFSCSGDCSGKARASIHEGGKRAVFAWLDCAMHQSGVRGSRPLAARRRLRWGPLQQLQRAASQCAASARPAHADASPLAGQLPSVGTSYRTPAVTVPAEHLGPLVPAHDRDEPPPQTSSL